MTIVEMDQLKVGDKVEVRTGNKWQPTEVSEVLVVPDGSRFSHGGYHLVRAKVKGFAETFTATLTPELTRLAEPTPNIN